MLAWSHEGGIPLRQEALDRFTRAPKRGVLRRRGVHRLCVGLDGTIQAERIDRRPHVRREAQARHQQPAGAQEQSQSGLSYPANGTGSLPRWLLRTGQQYAEWQAPLSLCRSRPAEAGKLKMRW